MLTVKDIADFGADTESALVRCVSNEQLYLNLVRRVPDSQDFEALEEAISQKNFDAAFDIAHGLKGVLTNLSLTPISDPVSTMTELLRNKEDVDYSDYLEQMKTQREKLRQLCEQD